VFWVGTASTDADPSAVGRFVNDRYYNNSAYAEFWVTYEGKPLLLTTDTIPSQLADDFTMRKMWGLQTSLANGEWSFLQDAPQNVGTMDGVAEEISVCVAKQATYISDKATATSRNQGQTFADQWVKAFEVHPKVVMLTGWNEWMAQRQVNDANGNPQFVDEYDSGMLAMTLLF
jgi:putative SOS response-associated peptidase YedK